MARMIEGFFPTQERFMAIRKLLARLEAQAYRTPDFSHVQHCTC